MRLGQKKQILELVSTLWKAFDKIVSMIEKQQYSEAEVLLADCQEGAVTIGTAIEKLVGEDLPIIRKLEEYCELLYQIHGELRNPANLSKKFKVLRKKLSQIDSSIKNDIPIQYEIVFMPYKASMWDCMESIWYAAKEDERCDCYVVPIPYYTFNSQGAIEKMCYEGEELPDYIPITDYKQYHLDLRKPDVIYIHNPYDQYNYITSVLPEYYSSNLKKYTQMLVYVPYFMTNGGVPENMKNLPVYNNMDKIVIQSNRQKEFYLPEVPEEKLLPLGSPKADRAIYYNEHKPPMPKDWKEIIGDRKLIMYNTSISGVLQFKGKALKKMQSVFSYFKDRDDAVLLWRPHPLLRDTIKSMLPEFLEEFDAMEKTFVENKRGILDTTGDITKSAALCSAYIGEETSSVVTIFGVMGKPVFILDINIMSKRDNADKRNIEFLNCYEEDNHIWFVANNYNLLCEMDLNTGQIDIMSQLKEYSGKWGEFNETIKVNERLIVQPFNSSIIVDYDIKNKVIIKKDVPNAAGFNFIRAINYKDNIFLIPNNYPAIVSYNLNNRNLEYYQDIITEIPVDTYGGNSRFCGIAVRGNKLLMLSTSVSKAIEFDMDTKKMKVLLIGDLNNGYFDMTYDGKDYWLTPYHGKSIIRWNYETGDVVEFKNFPECYVSEEQYFSYIVYGKSSIFIFSGVSSVVITIELATEKVNEFRIFESKLAKYLQDIHGVWLFAKKINNSKIIGMFAGEINRLVVIDIETEAYHIYSCHVEKKEFEKYISAKEIFIKFNKVEYGINIAYLCYENGIQTIDEFLKYLSDMKHNTELQKSVYGDILANLDATCGEKIHKDLMKSFLSEKE